MIDMVHFSSLLACYTVDPCMLIGVPITMPAYRFLGTSLSLKSIYIKNSPTVK